ncbi:MAG TPA: Flp pilus assembly protein CpaB [Gemmatimonadaceae bacterium]|jgi:pilus assembly protein CpaB
MADTRYRTILYGALIVAGAATFGAYRLLAANNANAKIETAPVVVATADVPEGGAIDRVMVTTAVWPKATIPTGAYTSIDSVQGRVARVNIFSGEVIVPGRLAPAGTGPGLELKIPPGQRAMSVRINDVAGIAGLIQPNSRVDVLVNIVEPTTNKQVAKLFMENMRVLAIGTELQRDASGKPISAPTVTLAVTPDEAERLAVAMNQGTIAMVLRGYGDPDSVKTKGATSGDVLSQLQLGGRVSAPTSHAPARRSAPAPRPVEAAPAPRPEPPRRPDSATVNVYRAGKQDAPLKFDTTSKR